MQQLRQIIPVDANTAFVEAWWSEFANPHVSPGHLKADSRFLPSLCPFEVLAKVLCAR